MELALVVDISCKNALAQAIDIAKETDACIKLKVNSITEFKRNIDGIAGLLSEHYPLIKGLQGPRQVTSNSTLFEDTVFIASDLEDYFDIELSLITTYDGKHIQELADFYSTICNVNTIKEFDALKDIYNPIIEALNLERMRQVQSSPNFGLCYLANLTPSGLFTRHVSYAIAEYVNEVYFQSSIDFSQYAGIPYQWLIDLTNKNPNFFLSLEFPSIDIETRPDLIKNATKNIYVVSTIKHHLSE